MPTYSDRHEVISKGGQRVVVYFYPDGSIRFYIPKGGPMAITEAYLEGAKKGVIVRVAPR